MTLPLCTLIIFALWTLLVLALTVGIYRWSRILSGKVKIHTFRAGEIGPGDKDFYRRAMRAHLNCVENLPVYAVLILTLTYLHLSSLLINTLCVIFILARMLQTIIHVSFEETDSKVFMRFTFFTLQIVIMFILGLMILL